MSSKTLNNAFESLSNTALRISRERDALLAVCNDLKDNWDDWNGTTTGKPIRKLVICMGGTMARLKKVLNEVQK